MPIRGIITDVDGVIVGDYGGDNFPLPGKAITDKLHELHEKGTFVCLCTGKPFFSISKIALPFSGPHISDGGSVIVKDGEIIKIWELSPELVLSIIETLQNEGVYTEIFAEQEWYVQDAHQLTDSHMKVLQKEPIVVQDLKSIRKKINKIVAVIDHPSKEKGIEDMLSKYSGQVTISWAIHPSMPEIRFGIITSKGITKETGIRFVSDATGIPLSDLLGIGDGVMDWDFIKLCGYKAAMGNAEEGLKKRVTGPQTYIGKDVDSGGFLDVIDHFFS